VSAAPATNGPGPKQRLAYLDWTRGIASLIMIQGHVFHSFTHKDLRNTSAYQISQFVGGMPPAVFLFLTGVTFAFLLHSLDKRQATTGERLVAGLKRAGFFFALAYLFRLQLFITGQPGAQWGDLLKVDILNAMGLAVVPLTLLAVVPALDRVRLGAAIGVLIMISAPIFSELSFDGLPTLMKMYLKPDYNYFSFFPWAAFMAFGVAFGAILRLVPRDSVERLMQWTGLLGFALVVSGQFLGNFDLSLYTRSEYWLDSPALVVVKLGIVLVLLAVAFVWTEYGLQGRYSWVALFGTHSLFIYWVHIELIYGQALWKWKETLAITPTAIAAIGAIVLMGLLTYSKQRYWDTRPKALAA
jgi:uncharacterized membrane protein